jgi:type IV secretion system protein VirB10
MTDGTQSEPVVTPDLRLRAERPRVTRLSRKVLIGLGGASGLAIAAALIYALQTRKADQASKELYSTENRTTADGLTGLPRDYAGVPRLGPPLPGDLGRPILSAQNQVMPVRKSVVLGKSVI